MSRFPATRLQRLRRTPELRELFSEVRLHPSDFMLPLFLVPGTKIRSEISSLPNQFHLSVDQAVEFAKKIRDLGIRSVLLFGIPEKKDETGELACSPDGIIQRGTAALKEAVPNLTVATDLCFCEYLSHGHCGILRGETVDNDLTLKMLAKQAVSHARAGADLIAPSGMMDGMIGAIRHGLDEHGFSMTAVMSYAAKFSSAFYGPFRDAVHSAPSFGDRKTYQMSPCNLSEAIREVELDVGEGADIVMVKPALPYLDVIRRVKDEFKMPTAAYHVSGEYVMLKLAAGKGAIDGTRAMLESLTSIKRAGADLILSYCSEEFATLFNRGETDIF